MRFRFCIAALALLAGTETARADFTIAIGTKWTPVNYTTPVSTSGPMATATPLQGWNTTNLNNYLGFFFLDGRLGFHLALDLGYSSREDDVAMTKTNLSFTQFGFAVGGKFYFTKPRGGKVSPYAYLDFYKYFASISTSATLPKGYEGYIANLVSPLGIDVAVGAEYFFTPAFSIGAEVFGIKYAYTNGSFDTSGGIGAAAITSTTNHYLTFFTGLSLNYRFDIKIAASVREASDETEEEPRPKPRKKAPPPEEQPTGEKPPANPESVD
jgi:hypothetical protein